MALNSIYMYDVVVPCLITDSPTCIRLISLVNYVFHAISLIVYIILVFYVLLSKNILPKNYTKLNSLISDCDVQKVSLYIDYIYVKFWNIWEYLWVFRLFKKSLYKKKFHLKGWNNCRPGKRYDPWVSFPMTSNFSFE